MSNQNRVGRATVENPPNRFETIRVEADLEHHENAAAWNQPRKLKTEFFADQGRTLICENHSPDLPFRYSINPYRGCEHGCANALQSTFRTFAAKYGFDRGLPPLDTSHFRPPTDEHGQGRLF
jgi:hypothetical protein